ncbi:NACHT, LRR and PYD domains-containing protein 1-like [Cebidichthys violaceus]|uniref:NACHT, LRR and PYD domains-containing protein 1-like n=1 Tax=Cebidichthys violaceus TaxID=271503 RepID=UPI0035CB350A
MAQEAELLYRTVQWDDGLLQPASKKAAGMLYDIKSSEDAAVSQLHLPHCETKDALVFDGLLSVANITDDGMTILEPLEITDTHVVVKVPSLSVFGLVWNIYRRFRDVGLPIKGQVLLFLRPPFTRAQILNVFLLQDNISVDEVAIRHEEAKYIKISSDCLLDIGQRYSVHSEPAGFWIQPEGEQFDPMFGPNFHTTFEVFLTPNMERVTLWIQDGERNVVWKSDVLLQGPGAEIQQRNVSAMGRVQKLFSVWTLFVNSVSDPVLDRLLDKLLERGVITDAGMQSARTKDRADKA